MDLLYSIWGPDFEAKKILTFEKKFAKLFEFLEGFQL